MGSKALQRQGLGESSGGGDPWDGPLTGYPVTPPMQAQTSATIPVNQGDVQAQALPSPGQPDWTKPMSLGTALSTLGGWMFGNGTAPSLIGGGQFNVNPGALQLNGYADLKRQLAEQSSAGTAQQNAIMAMLLGAANGTAPSVAQEQLKQGTEANLAAGVAAANSVRGPGGAAQSGQLLANQALAGQQMAGQASLLRAQEMTTARGQLVQAQAQFEQVRQAYLQMGLSLEQADLQARQFIEQQQQSAYESAANRSHGIAKDIASGVGNALGGLAGGGGK